MKVQYCPIPRQMPARTHEVDLSNGWRMSDTLLWTKSVATCVLLAVHNQSTRRILLGHFEDEDPRLELAVRAIPELGRLDASSIVLAGACSRYGKWSKDEDLGVLASRRSAEEAVRAVGLREPQLQTVWTDDQNTAVNAYLDTQATLFLEKINSK